MYLIKTPQIIQNLLPNFTWKVPTFEKELYLTFDDGPSSEITQWILDQLAEYDAKATFFCVGEEIEKYPGQFKAITDAGHTVGNHTYSHPNGWSADNISYFHDVRHCAELVKSDLFRPPYGRLLPKQSQFLERHYKIIMWDVMSGDFDENITKEDCLNNVVKNAKQGSIVVFHDNLKSKEKLQFVLPKVLEHYAEQGYIFKKLTSSEENSLQNDRDTAIAA